jgi:hypothetical protein
METWGAIPGYEGRYEVSDLGRVRSLRRRGKTPHGGAYDNERPTPLILRTTPISSGYLSVSLGGKSCLVHRLVLAAFVGPCPDGFEGSHLNGRPVDNRRANLAWETRPANNYHKAEHGTIPAGDRHGSRTRPEARPRGERNAAAKLTVAQVLAIRAARAAGETVRGIAARYEVSPATVHRIGRREKWAHL